MRIVKAQAIDWLEVLSHLKDLAIAYALALPTGWDRERAERSAGIRTFPWSPSRVAASCWSPCADRARGAAQARVLEGLITGIGFVGGGAILNQEGCGSGTATAARLWATGTLGGAVGYGLRQRGAHRRRDLCTLRWTRVFKTHKDSAGPVLDGNVE